MSGYHRMTMKLGPPTLLTEAEEQVIVNYITGSRKRAHPVTKRNVMNTVTHILDKEREMGIERNRPFSCSDDNEPGEKWWKLFRKRHPTIVFRNPETLSSARKNISVAIIKQWFHDVRQYLCESENLDILSDPSRVFNIDESGFSLSPKHGKVLALVGDKHVFEEVSHLHKTNITVLGNVCADGSIPPCMIIYPRKRIHVEMVEEFPENYEFAVGKSEKGYITYETLYEFLCNTFYDWLKEKDIKLPVLVFTDWHETRNNFYLASKLNELGIILYGLPPNCTHLMQPLDVSIFGPLKKGWQTAVKNYERENPDEIVTQKTFAKVFLPAYYK